MKLVTITAATASEALARVHEQLGPDAVVVNVRRLPVQGVARLWQRQGPIEVVAFAPELADRHWRQAEAHPDAYVPFEHEVASSEPQTSGRPRRRWRSIVWLESMGLWREYADRLEASVMAIQGAEPPALPAQEWAVVRQVLAGFWRPCSAETTAGVHVFVGPPGSGKSTVLCKWLTQVALREEQRAVVWRLDGHVTNTADFVSLHCEMLNVPVSRCPVAGPDGSVVVFVDLPGVDPHDPAALAVLRHQLGAWPDAKIHLVLNAAYETLLLFEQWSAFGCCRPSDLIFTHLDEERRRVKLWNFVLGTHCSIRFLSAGQKIPGEFRAAVSDLLFPQPGRSGM
ncbi:MAG: hypothetical protein RMN51_03470 [Verrucomicrobiota bacterium]|nr:hypothetical protein [Limisphaera sp.]MDW8381159.1 hypothetical protein [Verrucomicrobiota bacterium]